jgi:hypothetical protein
MEEQKEQPNMDTLVESAYTAFVTAMGGQDLEHRPYPAYGSLHVTQREAWKQALLAASTVFQSGEARTASAGQATEHPPSHPEPEAGGTRRTGTAPTLPGASHPESDPAHGPTAEPEAGSRRRTP